MTTQAERLKLLMESRDIPTRKQRRSLAGASGASYEAVRQWFDKNSDNISSEYLVRIAKHYKCRLDWLVAGIGPMESGPGYSNGREIESEARKIPILNYIQAGNPKQVVNDYMLGGGMDEIAIDGELDQELSMGAFALIVAGNSMAPEFIDGDVVIVDPNVEPWPGDVVVAQLENSEGATIKKYRSRGNDESGRHVFELVPINEDYHTITVSCDNPGYIVGTVVEHRRNLRRRR